MGDFTTGTMGDNQWAVDDLVSIKAASSPGAGIYDFSGTVPNHVYAEDGVSVTKDEIGLMTKAWWDGSSSGWSSDADYGDLAKTANTLSLLGRVRRESLWPMPTSLALSAALMTKQATLQVLSPWPSRPWVNPTRSKAIN